MSKGSCNIPSPRLARVRSPVADKKKGNHDNNLYIHLNRSGASRRLKIAKPEFVDRVDIAPTISAEEAFDYREMVMDHALCVIQKRIRAFLKRQKPKEPVVIHLNDRQPNTAYFKSGKVVVLTSPKRDAKSESPVAASAADTKVEEEDTGSHHQAERDDGATTDGI